MSQVAEITDERDGIPEGSISRDTDRHYCLMFGSNRLPELAKAIAAYGRSLSSNKHDIPIISVIDSNEYPQWEEQFSDLQKAARSCGTDVFAFTPEQKERCKRLIIDSIAEDSPELARELEEGLWERMLGSGCGPNKNWGMLLTMGFMVGVMDDDIRPFGLEFKGLEDFRDTENVFEGLEINIGQDVYKVLLSATEPLSFVANIGGEEIKPGHPMYDDLYRHVQVWGSDILAKYNVGKYDYDPIGMAFAILGLSVGEVKAQAPQYVTLGDHPFYDDSHSATCTTVGNFSHHEEFLTNHHIPRREINCKPHAPDRKGEVYRTTKQHPINMGVSHDGSMPRENQIIGYVSTPLTGVPDYDTLDFVREVIQDKTIEGQREAHNLFVIRKLNPGVEIYNRDLALAGGAVFRDNRKGSAPMMNLYMDEFPWRMQSMYEDTVAARIPFCQTHMRAPDVGENLAFRSFMEGEAGTLMQVMLLNDCDEKGMYRGDMRIPEGVVDEIIANGKKCWDELNAAADEDGISNKRRKLLKDMSAALKEAYGGFDHDTLHEQLSTLMRQELELYNSAHQVWGRLQEEFARHRSEIKVTDLKTGKEVSMQSIKDSPYKSEFTSETSYTLFSNTGKPNPVEIASYQGMDQRAHPLIKHTLERPHDAERAKADRLGLVQACREGWLDSIQYYLAHGVALGYMGDDDRTPFLEAVSHGQEAAVDALLPYAAHTYYNAMVDFRGLMKENNLPYPAYEAQEIMGDEYHFIDGSSRGSVLQRRLIKSLTRDGTADALIHILQDFEEFHDPAKARAAANCILEYCYRREIDDALEALTDVGVHMRDLHRKRVTDTKGGGLIVRIAKKLLKAGADVNAPSFKAPLACQAYRAGMLDLGEFLTSLPEFDIHARDRNGNTAIGHATQELLSDVRSFAYKCPEESTVLWISLQKQEHALGYLRRDVDALVRFISLGADLDEVGSSDYPRMPATPRKRIAEVMEHYGHIPQVQEIISPVISAMEHQNAILQSVQNLEENAETLNHALASGKGNESEVVRLTISLKESANAIVASINETGLSPPPQVIDRVMKEYGGHHVVRQALLPVMYAMEGREKRITL